MGYIYRTENGVVRMDDSVEGNELKGAEGDAMDSCFEGAYPKASDNSATTLNVFKKEDGILESRPVLTDKVHPYFILTSDEDCCRCN